MALCGLAICRSTSHPCAMTSRAARRYTAPFLFAVIELPFSAAVGMLQMAVPFWLAQQGLSIAQIGAVSAVGFMPHAWKFAWMPLLDTGLARRTWFFIATSIVAVFLGAVVLFPEPAQHLGTYTLLIVGAQVGAATTSSAVDALMALTADPAQRGRAAGFKMAGNVGGISMLGALLIWLNERATPTTVGLVIVAITIASAACGIFLGDEPPIEAPAPGQGALRTAFARIRGIGADLWGTVRSRAGWTGIVMCAAPVGAGALVNLLTGIAHDYRADAQLVELVDGPVGGMLAATGAIIGGFLINRMNRRVAYCLFAGATALCALAMAASPMTPTTYAAGSLSYRFFNGITMAAFSGMILEMVGQGRAVATTFTLFVAVSNQAIGVVTWLDGLGSTINNMGARGTVLTDAVLTFAGIGIVVTMMFVLKGRPAAVGPPHAPIGAAPR